MSGAIIILDIVVPFLLLEPSFSTPVFCGTEVLSSIIFYQMTQFSATQDPEVKTHPSAIRADAVLESVLSLEFNPVFLKDSLYLVFTF